MAELSQSFSHRLEHTRWGTAVYAACVAAVCYLVLQILIAVLIQGYSPWMPVRMIAAIVLGTGVLPETGFSFSVVLIAFLVHFGLSIMTAWIVAPIIEGADMAKAVLIGAAAGLVIYLVNFYLLTAAFSWFEGLRGWATLINHLIFGAVLAWVYKSRRLRAGNA